MAVKIACDSSTDLGQEFYKQNNVGVLPFTINLGEESFRDGIDINNNMIFEYVSAYKVLPKTSAINIYQYEEFFKENAGNDGLVFVSLSSKLSSTFNNALIASQNFDNVYVVDSLSLSTGGGLLVMYACELAKKGMSAKEIYDALESRKQYVQASFTIDKLDFLHKGGRCSVLKMLGANLLKLHPQIQLKNGAMGMNRKYRGKMKDLVKDYIDDTLNEFDNPDKSYCFVTHSNCDEEIVDSAISHLKSKNIFDKIIETSAGSTITSHCGKNTIGILYFNDGGTMATK